MVDNFFAEIDLPVPGFESVKSWIPRLNVGGDSDGNTTTALQVRMNLFGLLSPIMLLHMPKSLDPSLFRH